MEYKRKPMRVFLDTNIFMEFFEQRSQCENLLQILKTATNISAPCTTDARSLLPLISKISRKQTRWQQKYLLQDSSWKNIFRTIITILTKQNAYETNFLLEKE